MAGYKTWTIGDVLTASDLNSNFANLGWSRAAGTGDSTSGALAADATSTVNITYPTSRFSVAPIVSVWTSSNRYICSVGTNTAGSAIVTVRNVSAATGSDATVYWSAVQMTSTTAAG
jgi:hypothetical protein